MKDGISVTFYLRVTTKIHVTDVLLHRKIKKSGMRLRNFKEIGMVETFYVSLSRDTGKILVNLL